MNPCCTIASHTDAGEVAGMVNRAYRPAAAMGGWTHEADWIRERYAMDTGAPKALLVNVLECRTELVAFYERRGYRRTGVVRPYPVADGVGVPVVEGMKVVEMAKRKDG